MYNLICQITVLLLILGASNVAFASATQVNSTLNIVLDFVPPIPNGPEPLDQSASIIVDSGDVTIFGVPDDASGTLFDGAMFSGVNEIVVDSGAGNDKVSFEIVTTQNLDISVDSTSGQAETKIKMNIPSGAGNIISTIDLDFGVLEDKLELELDSQRDTNLVVDAMGASGEKSIAVKAMYGSGTNINNMFNLALGGFEDETSIEIKSEANSLTNLFWINSGAGEDIAKIVIEQLGTGPTDNTLMLTHGTGEDGTDVIIKSPSANVALSGMVNAGGGVFGDEDKVNIEVDGPNVDMTNLSIMSGTGQDEMNTLFKGTLNLSGALTLSGGNGDDKLKVLVEGGLLGGGIVTLDGGEGFDECEAFMGVTFTDCEIEKQ